LRAKGEAISSLSSSLLRRSAPRKDISVKEHGEVKKEAANAPLRYPLFWAQVLPLLDTLYIGLRDGY
jgi:hypothetical protein